MHRTQFFHMSNDFHNKTGIVTLAAKIVNEDNPARPTIRVGYHLTPPNEKLDERRAKREAKKDMESNTCAVMAGHASSGKMVDTVRLAWGAAIQPTNEDYNEDFPEWAKNLDLAMKCHVL